MFRWVYVMGKEEYCVGIDGNNYIYFNAKSGTFSGIGLKDKSFNEKKYKELKKSPYDIVYTVIGTIELSYVTRYIVVSDTCNVYCLNHAELLESVKNNNYLNYSVVKREDTEYIRKSSAYGLYKFDEDSFKNALGYSINDYKLTRKMTINSLYNCMELNEFKPAYVNKFKYDNHSYIYLIFINSEGVQMRFHCKQEENNMYCLDYIRPELVYMRHVDSKYYSDYLGKEGRYLQTSTCPIDGIKTDITVFTSSDYSMFIPIVSNMSKYSTPCVPYYKSQEGIEGFSSLGFMMRFQYEISEKISDKLKVLGYLVNQIIRYINIQYINDTNNLYRNYLDGTFFERLYEYHKDKYTKKEFENLYQTIIKYYNLYSKNYV